MTRYQVMGLKHQGALLVFALWAFVYSVWAGAEERLCSDGKRAYFGVCPRDPPPPPTIENSRKIEPSPQQNYYYAKSNVEAYFKWLSSKGADADNLIAWVGSIAFGLGPMIATSYDISGTKGGSKEYRLIAIDDPTLFGNQNSKIASAIQLERVRRQSNKAQTLAQH